jgi:hypothetical protein
MIKKFNDYIKEDSSTTPVVGSGQAVGGGATGTFTSAAGTSVSGGDSGTAFSTNSNSNGMGAIVSPQPSSIPGDVRGGTEGSGDIGYPIGNYSKHYPNYKRKKKKKKDTTKSKKAEKIDKLTIQKFSDMYK